MHPNLQEVRLRFESLLSPDRLDSPLLLLTAKQEIKVMASSALQQEYEEGIQALGEPRMQFYKLLSLFSFEGGNEVHFGEGIAGFCDDRTYYEQLKEYIKEQKKWVRSECASPSEIRSRSQWLYHKLLAFGIFTSSELRTILLVFQYNG